MSEARKIGLFNTWPRRIALSILVLSVALAVSANAIVGGYDPLAAGGTWFPQGWTLEEDFDGGVMTTPYVHGGTVRYGIDLRNEGRWGVTVTGVGESSGLILARVERVFIRADPVAGGDGERLIPFEPFALPAGEERGLVLELRFGDCQFYAPGSGQMYTGLPVQYRVGMFDRSMDVELAQPFKVDSPEGCPTARELGAAALSAPATGIVRQIDNVLICVAPDGGPEAPCYDRTGTHSVSRPLPRTGDRVTVYPKPDGTVGRIDVVTD